MKKSFTLLQLFQIVDGRITTDIGDICDILNHVCGTSLYMHHLPVAKDFVEHKKPVWYTVVKNTLDTLGVTNQTDFWEWMEILKANNEDIIVPQLRDEFPSFDMEFQQYMIKHSLILNKK